MDDEQIRRVVRAVLSEIMETVGVDVSTPDGRKEFRDNMDWVRSFRAGATGARTAVVGTGLASLAGGIIWLVLQGVKAALAAARVAG